MKISMEIVGKPKHLPANRQTEWQTDIQTIEMVKISTGFALVVNPDHFPGLDNWGKSL